MTLFLLRSVRHPRNEICLTSTAQAGLAFFELWLEVQLAHQFYEPRIRAQRIKLLV